MAQQLPQRTELSQQQVVTILTSQPISSLLKQQPSLSLTVDRLDACVLLLLRLPERICVERDPQGFDGGAHAQDVVL